MPFLRNFFSRTTILSPKSGLGFPEWGRRECSTVVAGDRPYKTMKQIANELMRILDIDIKYSAMPKNRSHLMRYLPKTQEELPPRSMRHSFDSAIIPLSTDPELQDKYVSYLGEVRIGRLIEDVDLFAVWCSVKHLMDPDDEDRPFPYIIVTLLIDRIDMLKSKLKATGDVRLWGHVCWVGLTSIEVSVWLDQFDEGRWRRITKALLLMAARNPMNTGPAIVNPIMTETVDDEKLVLGAEERRVKRMQKKTNSLFKKAPSEEELALIHSLFIKTISEEGDVLGKRVLPPNSKWMTTGCLNNLIFCHPENRNMYNKIFGGFIIRQALELAWLTAYLFGTEKHTANPPRLIKISDIRFLQPLDVGSLVKLNACPTYVEGEYLQIFVFAEVFTTDMTEGKNTNSFYFTFNLGQPCDTLYPVTYLEAMKFIEGRRHFVEEVIDAKPVILPEW